MTVSAVTDIVNYPGADIACYAPTYDLLKLITEPYLCGMLEEARLPFAVNKSDHIIDVRDLGNIICRSLSNPSRIIGYEVFRSHVDELDTLRPALAEDAWNKVIARNRQPVYKLDSSFNRILRPDWRTRDPLTDGYFETELNRVSGYTTPEGFMFAYKRWVKEGGTEYAIYRASTYSNPHLPDGYIQGLLDTYPEQLIEAYLLGEFVNLTSGAVYPAFDRVLNGSTEVVVAKEPLNVGMDFNVYFGAAGVHVTRDGVPHCVGQVHNAYDTDAQIAELRNKYPHNPITVYPDASGDSKSSSNTTETDIAKLRAAGFRIKMPNANGPIKNRVASVNAKICNAQGERSYFVNEREAPDVVAGFEQQVYDKGGMPDKTAGLDHVLDGCGYYLNYEYGIDRPSFDTITTIGAY
tara:strand:- start:347 stop:1570 length:1224 start_codon:yes stop_codon:yes gene_type:complete